MRHRCKNNSSFNLKPGPRRALMRNLLNSLVEKERIKVTLTRAKALRPLIEKAITLGRRGDLSAQRLLLSRFANSKNVTKIIKVLSPRFKERAGGYTRIVKLGYRPGDQAPKALIEFIDYKFTPALSKEEKQKQKASREYRKSRRLLFKRQDAKRKKLRQLQSESRRINRV